jgi:rRNA maturation endonuclease Nob1
MVIYVDIKKKKPIVKKCAECGKEFEQKANVRYPRKYCPKCSEQRKKDYDNLWKVRAEDCEDAHSGQW